MGSRSDNSSYPIRDGSDVIAFFEKVWEQDDMYLVASEVLSHKSFWGEKDLTEISGLTDKIAFFLEALKTNSVTQVLETLI